jgi:hypothetical protein
MATLTQVKNEYTIFTGWYGDCSDNCNNFDLTQHLDVIYAVYEFKEDAKGVASFLSSAPAFLRDFSELVCGRMYYIVLQPGDDDLKSLNIPNLTQSFSSSEKIGYLKKCLDSFDIGPKFEITVSDFEYEGEVSDNENTSKAKVTIKVTNREGQRFTNPYAIAFTDESDVERGGSGNFGAPGGLNFKGRYFPNASNNKFSNYEYTNLVEWDSDADTYEFEVRGLLTDKINYACIYLANIDVNGSGFGGSSLPLGSPPDEYRPIDMYHWCTEIFSFNVPRILPEPTPTPTPVQSCCADDYATMLTDDTTDVKNFQYEFNGNVMTIASYIKFPRGELCFDINSIQNPTFDDFATSKIAYINDVAVGSLKFFVTNLSNGIVTFTSTDGNCYEGDYLKSESRIDFVFMRTLDNSEKTPTPLVGITPTPQTQFAPDYTDREPYPDMEGNCLEYINVMGYANGIMYLNGDESHTGVYHVGVGRYLIKDVSSAHPILLESTDTSLIEIIGTQKAVGPYGSGYYGDVTIYVKGNFEVISYLCAYHGYMGGQNNLVFDQSCYQTKNNFESMAEEYKYLDPTEKVELPEIVGYVKYIDLEGGFYGIVSKEEPVHLDIVEEDSEIRFLPLNLQRELKGKEGHVIKITDSYTKEDQVSIFMWGKLVYVNSFEYVDDDPIIGCPKDLRPCGNDGKFVVRDPKLECNFPPCEFNMDEFHKVKRGWFDENIPNYTFDFAWSCFCHEETTKTVIISVENHEIVSIVDENENEVSPDDSFGYFTMSGLFEFVQSELKKYPHTMSINYDFNTMSMKSWFVDRNLQIADEELGFYINNFRVD